MTARSSPTLRSHLVLFSVIIVLPILIAGAALGYTYQYFERQEIEFQAKQVTNDMATAVNLELGRLKAVLVVLANSTHLRNSNFVAFAHKAQSLSTSFPGTNIVVRTMTGQLLLNTGVPKSVNLNVRPNLILDQTDKTALLTNDFIISPLYFGAITKEAKINISKMVEISGAPHFLSVSIGAKRLLDVLLSSGASEEWLSVLTDSGNTIVARTRSFDQYVGKKTSPDIAHALVNADEGTLQTHVTQDGVPSFVTFKRVPGTELFISNAIPTAVLLKPLYYAWISIVLLALFAIAISVCAAILYGRKLTKGVKPLAFAAARLATMQTIKPEPTGVHEFDAVDSALVSAASDLHALTVQREELNHRLANAQEEERSNLARELHDEMGQTLIAAILKVKSMEGQVGATLRNNMHDLALDIGVIGERLMDVVSQLRPPAIEQLGLRIALEDLVTRWSELTGIPVTVDDFESNLDQLGELNQVTLYRIVQEALTNVAKHAASATSVSICLQNAAGGVSVTIEDNGPGFDPEAQASAPTGDRTRGFGLSGMRERAMLVGGTLDIESSPGSGTTVHVRLAA